MADAEQVQLEETVLAAAHTGMELGGVTPFGLPAGMPLYIDARVAERARVIVGGGSRRVKLDVEPAALTAIGGEVVEGLAHEPPDTDRSSGATGSGPGA